MHRGFKSQAEKLSLELRVGIGLAVCDRLYPKQFLETRGITVWAPSDIPSIDPNNLVQLAAIDSDDWSGVTVREGGAIAIIFNPAHAETRTANTLIHEWAHIELRHKPNRVDRSETGLLLLSDYPAEVEEEANWLAGAVLLPRDGLLYHHARGLNARSIANHYGVSDDLATWRLRMTGVEKQIRYRSQRTRKVIKT